MAEKLQTFGFIGYNIDCDVVGRFSLKGEAVVLRTLTSLWTKRPSYGRLAQLARALRLHRRGQGFESLSVHWAKEWAEISKAFLIAHIVRAEIAKVVTAGA